MHTGPEGRAGVAGPPVFLSNAHFCDVDPAVAETVVGLNCSESEHVTFLDVEPITGITMRAAKRLMMSTQYGPGQSCHSPHLLLEQIRMSIKHLTFAVLLSGDFQVVLLWIKLVCSSALVVHILQAIGQ